MRFVNFVLEWLMTSRVLPMSPPSLPMHTHFYVRSYFSLSFLSSPLLFVQISVFRLPSRQSSSRLVSIENQHSIVVVLPIPQSYLPPGIHLFLFYFLFVFNVNFEVFCNTYKQAQYSSRGASIFFQSSTAEPRLLLLLLLLCPPLLLSLLQSHFVHMKNNLGLH